ncbi:MAG TPA: YCF48-related protein [Prolixibacteraceae bacterium]|jgi:photosystem II stability/assembly factor-like uncharacterized protein
MIVHFSFHRSLKVKLVLLLVLSLLAGVSDAQFPYLKANLKTNLYKITCLDDFEMEATQVNWQFLSQRKKEFLFQNLHFTSPEKGAALAFVTGMGEDKYFLKTSDRGVTWDYDNIIEQTYVAHMQFFGKDSILLLGKKRIDWYVYERWRYLSKDGGATWDSVRTNMNVDPEKTCFINAKVGYCVDMTNAFLLTTDGGINWAKQGEVAIGFKKDLFCLNVNEMFLLNDNALYRSGDGGKNWRKISLPLDNGLSDFCLKGQTGFISSRLGSILKTEDGGETWKVANSRLFPNLLKIEMLNKDSVFAVGNLGTILFSADAGKIWQQQYTDNRADLYEINLTDRRQIMAGGMYGVFRYYPPATLSNYEWGPGHLIVSANGNKAIGNATYDSWISVSAKDQLGVLLEGNLLVKVESPGLFVSSDTVPDYNSKIRLHALTDAGAWSLHKEEFVMVYYHDLEKINQDTAFIGGQYDANGVILKTTDGGLTWNHVDQNIDYRIDDIEFVGSKIGYAGGYLGYLIKTVDGGDHWEKLVSPTKDDIKSISFVNEQTGYLAADHGQIYKTSDGGSNWEYSHLPYDWAIKILFLNEQKGFLLHSYSGFLSTTDGGKSWQEVPHDKFNDIMDLTFVNEHVGYAVGSMLGPFVYLKTLDGGKTWMEKIFPRWTQTTYQTVSFKDEYSGFVFNSLGEMIQTGDGGQNWFVMDTLRFNEPNTYGKNGFPVNSFQFMTDHTAIGVGNGQIIQYQFSPEISYNWYPDTEVEDPLTAHAKVPTYLSPSYVGSISRNSSCGTSVEIEIPELNVFAPTIVQSTISIYPQPALGELNIESSELLDFDRIELFDMNGRSCYSKIIKGNKGKVAIQPALSPGMYLMAISGEKRTIRKTVSFQ